MNLRVVMDTSALVSAALRPGSIPDQALAVVLSACELCASAETLDELTHVLDRGKFDRYRDRESRREFVELIRSRAHLFAVGDAARSSIDPPCRDPEDIKFLALALAAEASAIVSSDQDLLVLNPWHGIPILAPAEFLNRLQPSTEQPSRSNAS